MVQKAYHSCISMGGELTPSAGGEPPAFLVAVRKDQGTSNYPGTEL
jgi:hypothetical protein